MLLNDSFSISLDFLFSMWWFLCEQEKQKGKFLLTQTLIFVLHKSNWWQIQGKQRNRMSIKFVNKIEYELNHFGKCYKFLWKFYLSHARNMLAWKNVLFMKSFSLKLIVDSHKFINI